ncbi:hypothetical protein K1719_008357 [Acacia pycnantha]|nr:hypothetical protein K1719_008357 [Acacia pycnantha]
MSSYLGVLISDQELQSQFTQVELRTLKSKFLSAKIELGRVKVGDLPSLLKKLKVFVELFDEDEIKAMLRETYQDMNEEIDFECEVLYFGFAALDLFFKWDRNHHNNNILQEHCYLDSPPLF